VIEVNLSPACFERTDWLRKMLSDMSFDLVTYLDTKIIMSCDDWQGNLKEKKESLLKNPVSGSSILLNDEQFYKDNDIKYKWLRI